jgi:16S rRNA (guanine527-N7)-methyltransferase
LPDGSVSRETPPAARELFGARLPLAEQYAHLLETAGIERGLIGPREAPRIWDRHIINCAVIAPAVPAGAFVVDIGSGAGLPGIVLALARPDLRVVLVEPMQRRVDFLAEVIRTMDLGQVEVRRARAEELSPDLGADVVTARAVAPLDQLVRLTVPLLAPGGVLLALKGARAADELAAARDTLRACGAVSAILEYWGGTMQRQPTTLIRVLKGEGRSP